MTSATVDAADRPTVVGRMVAPKEWQAIDFISDLHLADDTPQGFDAWAAYLGATPADAVFILGDLFEAWPGDDARFDAFEGRCAAVLKASSAQRFTAFMVGNRDFLAGNDLLADCGVKPLDDPTALQAFGQTALLSHGDAWCLTDTDYLRLRTQLRSSAWRSAVLAQTLAQRRTLARQLRDQSEQQAGSRSDDDWADVDGPLALTWLRANAASVLIHGHTHRPASEWLAPGFRREVLSDWNLDHVRAPGRAEVLRWRADGFERLTPAAAATALAAAPMAPALPTAGAAARPAPATPGTP